MLNRKVVMGQMQEDAELDAEQQEDAEHGDPIGS
jgi:hypothetical protein